MSDLRQCRDALALPLLQYLVGRRHPCGAELCGFAYSVVFYRSHFLQMTGWTPLVWVMSLRSVLIGSKLPPTPRIAYPSVGGGLLPISG